MNKTRAEIELPLVALRLAARARQSFPGRPTRRLSLPL